MAEIPTAEQLMALPPEYLAEDTSRVLFNVTTAFAVLTTLVYGLFFISRNFSERNTWEIWTFPAFAFIFNIGLWAISFCAVPDIVADFNVTALVDVGGAGRHVAYWFITDPNVITTYLKLQTAAEFVYVAACLFPKLSILVLYLKIFTSRPVRICAWIVIGVCIAHATANIIASFTICQPFEFKWNKMIDGHCADVMASYRYVSVPHILSDLAILILPLASLWHLQMSKRRKLGIILTFLMGSAGIITAIIRFVSFFTVDLESDPTWYAPNLFSYTIVEPSAYFMCSCFPCLRPLMRASYRWARTKVDGYYGTATDNSAHSDLSLRNLKGSHKTSISSPKVMSARANDDSTSHFIRLDESVDVDISPRYVGENGHASGRGLSGGNV